MQNSRIKQLRTEAGMTQEELAAMIDVSRSMVAMWESGVRELRAYEMSQLSGVFQVPVECLSGDERYSDLKKWKIDLSQLNSDGLSLLYSIYDTLRCDPRYKIES